MLLTYTKIIFFYEKNIIYDFTIILLFIFYYFNLYIITKLILFFYKIWIKFNLYYINGIYNVFIKPKQKKIMFKK